MTETEQIAADVTADRQSRHAGCLTSLRRANKSGRCDALAGADAASRNAGHPGEASGWGRGAPLKFNAMSAFSHIRFNHFFIPMPTWHLILGRI